MRLAVHRSVLLVAFTLLLASAVHAQNTSFATSVHLLVGQTPMRATLTTGATATRYYDAPVVKDRSYCAEATASETEVGDAHPTLAIFDHLQAAYPGVTDSGNAEPKGGTAARMCFIATATEQVFIRLTPFAAAFENREYTVRFVETTAYTNWFFVGGTYSSYTLIRNTTNTAINYSLFWRNAAGAVVGTNTGSIPGNGIIAIDARSMPAVVAAVSGSAELAHTGSPEGVVGSQTTLAGATGLSFDTLFFQRRAW